MNYLIIVLGFFLLLFSIIDFKFKAIPSIFLTGILFALAVLNADNFYYGILAGLFALLIFEFDFISGIADLKVIIMIGLMFTNFWNLAIFMGLVVVYGTIWKLLIKYILKEKKEIAFIPVLFFTYVSCAVAGLIV